MEMEAQRWSIQSAAVSAALCGAIGYASVRVVRWALCSQTQDKVAPEMEAVCFSSYGCRDVLENKKIPRPKVTRATDVLVRVYASSVNPVDWKIRKGNLLPASLFWVCFPDYVTGRDLSGVVVEVGKKVTNFRPGDEVFALTKFWERGTHAEFALCDQDILSHKPKCLDHAEAASLPLVALTVWQSLVQVANVRPGNRVLVLGGSGGVGSVALPLLRQHLRAQVVVTCSERNADLCKALGAHQVVDYTKEKFFRVLEPSSFDVVFDVVGGQEAFQYGPRMLKKGGILVTISGPLPDNPPGMYFIPVLLKTFWFVLKFWLLKGTRTKVVAVTHSGSQLAKIASLVDQGVLKPRIHQIFPLSKLADAHALSEKGRTTGKIVLQHPEEAAIRPTQQHWEEPQRRHTEQSAIPAKPGVAF